jgi:hypothetical protein
MRHRSHLPAGERAVRSRLAQLVHSQRLLRGSVVTMSRTCGKQGCKCTRGDRHVSLYLSIRAGKKRRMIYIPLGWQERVRSWVEASHEADGLLEKISQACLECFLKEKQGARPEGGEKGR